MFYLVFKKLADKYERRAPLFRRKTRGQRGREAGAECKKTHDLAEPADLNH